MNIDTLVDKYKLDNTDLIEYIKDIVNEKYKLGEWDRGVKNQSDNLVTLLMYEYSTSIEKLTEGKIASKQVIDKLSSKMGKLRFGDFKIGIDDNVSYDECSVTSDEYKKRYRTCLGAQTVEYKNDGGEEKSAVALFDDKQLANIDGVEKSLFGIDLQDLSDVRHTAFHEWTHVMEKCMVKTSELSKEDVIYKNGKSTYINAQISPDLTKQEYESYVSNIDNLLNSDTKIAFAGISTIELNDKKNPNRRIMHNQISEGATEFISRKVMETIGEEVKHPDRYFEQVKIIGDIFNGNGLSDSLTTYLTEPHKVIRQLENKRVKDKDMLHYISDYINSSHIAKLFTRCKIDKFGNVKTSIISKLVDRFKNSFSSKDNAALLQGETTTRNDDEENFFESIRVSPEEVIENIQQQRHFEKEQIVEKEQENMELE